MLLLVATAFAAELPEGRYALALRISTEAAAGWLPTVRSTSTSRVMLDLRRDGAGWVQTTRVCGVDIGGSKVAQIVVPPAFIAAMPEKRQAVRQQDGGYFADLGLDRVGFEGELLPTSAADAPDWDRDGHPGATVHAKVAVLGGGEVYVAQAAWLALDGTVNKDGGASGPLRVRRFEQRTVGADPGWLGMDTHLIAIEKKSSFVLTPVAADADCAAVLAATHRVD